MEKVSKTAGKATALTVATGAAFMAQGVHAIPMTVVHNVDLGGGTPLSNSGSGFSGQFNIVDLLPGSGSFNQPLDVLFANVQAFGYSAAQTTTSYSTAGSYSRDYYSPYYRTAYSTYYYSYRCGFAGWSTCYGSYTYSYYVIAGYRQTGRYTRDILRTYVSDPVADTMRVDAGVQTASDTVDRTTSYTDTSSYGSGSYRTDYIRTTQEDISSGPLSIDMVLDSNSLLDLSLDGLLDFNVAATQGNFMLTGLSLTAQVQSNPRANSAVPVPATALLMTLGALFAGTRRIQQQRRAI
jgi:hypothetical protein